MIPICILTFGTDERGFGRTHFGSEVHDSVFVAVSM